MTKDKRKLRAQVKSRFYYLFWGAATVSVFAGQLYVGSGYRALARGLNRLLGDAELKVEEALKYHYFEHKLKDIREEEKEHPMVIR